MPPVNRILVAASIVLGGIIGILAIADVSWMPTFAAIGGTCLGLAWALRAILLGDGDRERDHT